MTVSEVDRPGRRVSPGGVINPAAYLDEFPYTGPGTLAGRYLRQFWLPVGRSVDLPAGTAKPVTVMNMRYTLYRGQSGMAHLVDHHCAHRGTQLSVGFVEGDEIRCLYHGWKYRPDGLCTERPGELGRAGGGIRIGGYPTEEFLGLIYAYLGEGAPPAFPPYPGFEGEGVVEAYATVFPVNYFQGWENDWDAYHARYTHMTGQLHEFDYDATLASERYEEHEYGVMRTMDIGGGRINRAILLMPTTTQLLIPAFNELARRGTGPAARVAYIIHVPIDDQSHWAYVTQFARVASEELEEYREQLAAVESVNRALRKPAEIAAEILARGGSSLCAVRDHPMLVEIEDQLAQGGQGAIADRHAEHLGRTDAGIVMLRRIFARELHALSEGRPTQRWTLCPRIPEDGWYM